MVFMREVYSLIFLLKTQRKKIYIFSISYNNKTVTNKKQTETKAVNVV